MQKTAAEIADCVLFKVAMEELLEKEGLFGAGGNWAHVLQRLGERIAAADRPLVRRIIENTAKKLAKAPQAPWYRVVRRGKDPIGYIVGQGKYISSVYSKDMVPRGKPW